MSKTVNIDLKIQLIDIPNSLGQDRYYYALKLSDYGTELDLLKTNGNKLTIPDIVISEEELQHNQCICVVGHYFVGDTTSLQIGSIDANINTPLCFKSLKMSQYKVVSIDGESYVILMLTVEYCLWTGDNTTVNNKTWKTTSTPLTGMIKQDGSSTFLKDGYFYTNSPDTKISVSTMIEPLSVSVIIDKDKMDYNIVNPAYAVNDRMANAEDLFVEFFIKQGTQNPIQDQDYYLYAPNKDYCPSRKEIESNTFKIAYQTKNQFDVYNTYMTSEEVLQWFTALPSDELLDGMLICLYRIFSPTYYSDFVTNIKSALNKFASINGMSYTWDDNTSVYDFIKEYSKHTRYSSFETVTNQTAYQNIFSCLFSDITDYILQHTVDTAIEESHYFCKNFSECDDNVPYIYLKDLSSDNIKDCKFHNKSYVFDYVSARNFKYYEPYFQYSGLYSSETNGSTTNQYFDPYIVVNNLYGQYKYYFKRCDYSGVSSNPNNTQETDFTMGQLIELHYMVIKSVFQYLVLENNSVTLTNLKVNTKGSNYIDRIKHEYTEKSLVRLCDIAKQYLLVSQYTYEPIISYLGMNSLRETVAKSESVEPTYEEPTYKEKDFTLKTTYSINNIGQSDSITASTLKPASNTFNAREYNDEECTNLDVCLYDSQWITDYKRTLPYNPLGQVSSMMPIFKVSSYNADDEEVVYTFQYNDTVPEGTVYSYEIWKKELNNGWYVRKEEGSHLLFVRPPLNNTPYIKSIDMQDCVYQPNEGSTASLPTITQFPKMYIVYVLLYQNSIQSTDMKTTYIPTGKTVYLESLESDDCDIQKVDEKYLSKQFDDCNLLGIYQRNFNDSNRLAYIITNLKSSYNEINKLHFKVRYKYATDDNSVYALNDDICIHLSIHGPYTDIYASNGLISMLDTAHNHVSHWDFGGNGFGTAYNPFCFPYHSSTYGKFTYIDISDRLNQEFALGMIKHAKTSTLSTSITYCQVQALLQETALSEIIALSYDFNGSSMSYHSDYLYGNSSEDDWYVMEEKNITYINDYHTIYSNYDSSDEGNEEQVLTIYITPYASPISDTENDTEDMDSTDYYKVVVLDDSTLIKTTSTGVSYNIDYQAIDNEQTQDGDIHLILFYEYTDTPRSVLYISPKDETFVYTSLKHNMYIHFMMVKGGIVNTSDVFYSSSNTERPKLLRLYYTYTNTENDIEIMAGDKHVISVMPSELKITYVANDNTIDYDYYYRQIKNK